MNFLSFSIGEQQRVEQLRTDAVPQTIYFGGSADQMQMEASDFSIVARGNRLL